MIFSCFVVCEQDLTNGLKTGEAQNEIKHAGTLFFETRYTEPAHLEAAIDRV